MKSVGLYRDPIFKKHMNDFAHPESPARLTAIDKLIEDFPHGSFLKDLTGRDATDEELEWVHTKELIRTVKDSEKRDQTTFDYETGANRYSSAAATRAAGAALDAVDTVVEGQITRASVLGRPPGHHAEANRAMGFCLYNSVAVAAEYALRRHEMERIFILDWDVHHGNGTMHSFFRTERVLYASIHQSPRYPGTGQVSEIGTGAGAGYTLNIPLPPGMGDPEYMAALEDVVLPVVSQYQPELILVSAGYDAHRADPLSAMRLTSSMYGDMTSILVRVADELSGGKIIFVLEGGYHLEALAESNGCMLAALCGAWEQRSIEKESHGAEDVLREVRKELQAKWTTLHP